MSDAPLMLSVSGARGIIGQTMTPAVAATYAAAFGSFVKSSHGRRAPVLCMGRDSRPSGPMLAAAATAGLTSVGCRVIELGVVPTPTVGVMIAKHGADAGMVITASHNPTPWNGLKCLNADGLAPPADDAAEIIRRFREGEVDYVDVDALQSVEPDESAHQAHLLRILAAIDPEPIKAAGLSVVLDSVNGAGCMPGRLVLESLGCGVEHLNGEPTGQFAHVPEPTKENLGELARATKAAGAACGFAQDPDADRLAVIDETGRYIGEEYTLVLAALRVLQEHGPGPIAANLSTSRMIDDLARQFPGTTVHRAAVGEANVAEVMQAKGAVIGGEGNGGVIFPPVCWVRDSLSSMALVLGLIATDPERRPLSAIVDALPRYEMIKQKMDLGAIGGRAAIEPMLDRARMALPDAEVNDLDGVRLDVEDGWVHLRPSNTEPIMRLIAEAPTEERARELIDAVSSAMASPA
jgi:phosphomannomutase